MKKLKQRNKRVSYNNTLMEHLSKDDMIYIQEEAYYRALKRIETEKDTKENECASERGRENIKLLLYLLIFPRGIKKKLKSNQKIYDLLLVVLIAAILMLIGIVAWATGIGVFSYLLIDIIRHGISVDKIVLAAFGILIWLLGSLFIVSGDVFSTESDSERIYAYSASLIAVVACVISVITLCREVI